MDWSEYVTRLMRGRQQEQVSDLTGVSQATISRWANGKQAPSTELAAQFARRAGGNPIEALIALGVIAPGELDQVTEVELSASTLSDEALVAEVSRRLRGAAGRIEGRRGA